MKKSIFWAIFIIGCIVLTEAFSSLVYFYIFDHKQFAVYSLAQKVSEKIAYYKTMSDLKDEINRILHEMPKEAQVKIDNSYMDDQDVLGYLEGSGPSDFSVGR